MQGDSKDVLEDVRIDGEERRRVSDCPFDRPGAGLLTAVAAPASRVQRHSLQWIGQSHAPFVAGVDADWGGEGSAAARPCQHLHGEKTWSAYQCADGMNWGVTVRASGR